MRRCQFCFRESVTSVFVLWPVPHIVGVLQAGPRLSGQTEQAELLPIVAPGAPSSRCRGFCRFSPAPGPVLPEPGRALCKYLGGASAHRLQFSPLVGWWAEPPLWSLCSFSLRSASGFSSGQQSLQAEGSWPWFLSCWRGCPGNGSPPLFTGSAYPQWEDLTLPFQSRNFVLSYFSFSRDLKFFFFS